MTDRAVARVAVDWQVQVAAGGDPAQVAAVVADARGTRVADVVEFASVPQLAADTPVPGVVHDPDHGGRAGAGAATDLPHRLPRSAAQPQRQCHRCARGPTDGGEPARRGRRRGLGRPAGAARRPGDRRERGRPAPGGHPVPDRGCPDRCSADGSAGQRPPAAPADLAPGLRPARGQPTGPAVRSGARRTERRPARRPGRCLRRRGRGGPEQRGQAGRCGHGGGQPGRDPGCSAGGRPLRAGPVPLPGVCPGRCWPAC